MADVDAAGMVRVRRNGETAHPRQPSRALVAVVVVTAPFDQPVDPARLAGRNNFIDEHVFAKLGRPAHRAVRPLQRRRVPPPRLPRHDRRRCRRRTRCGRSSPTSDPTSGPGSIDSLLERPEFVDYWARSAGRPAPEPQGARPRRARHQGRARLPRLAARAGGGQSAVGRAGPRRADRQRARRPTTRPSATTSSRSASSARPTAPRSSRSVAQAFLGTRIGCAKCHNHPLEKLHAGRLLPLRRASSRASSSTARSRSKGRRRCSWPGRTASRRRTPVGVTQPRTGQFLKPQPLDRSPTTVDAGRGPARQAGGVDHRPEERVFQRRDGQPRCGGTSSASAWSSRWTICGPATRRPTRSCGRR